jgi:hypothetical protein
VAQVVRVVVRQPSRLPGTPVLPGSRSSSGGSGQGTRLRQGSAASSGASRVRGSFRKLTRLALAVEPALELLLVDAHGMAAPARLERGQLAAFDHAVDGGLVHAQSLSHLGNAHQAPRPRGRSVACAALGSIWPAYRRNARAPRPF